MLTFDIEAGELRPNLAQCQRNGKRCADGSHKGRVGSEHGWLGQAPMSRVMDPHFVGQLPICSQQRRSFLFDQDDVAGDQSQGVPLKVARIMAAIVPPPIGSELPFDAAASLSSLVLQYRGIGPIDPPQKVAL